MITALRTVARLFPPGLPRTVAQRASWVLGGYRTCPQAGPWAADPAWGPTIPPNPPEGGFAVGVIWGEGMADHRSPTRGAGIRNYIDRLLRAVWHRLFAHEGQT